MATYDLYAAIGRCAFTGEDPIAPVLGKRAAYTTYEGERLVGTVEAPIRVSGGYPIIRFADGGWGRCDDLIELLPHD